MLIRMQTPDLITARLTELVRRDFPALVLGVLITASGLAALGVHALRRRNPSRILLWFGVFALLYGVRALVKTPLSELLFDYPQDFWYYAERIIGNFILIPALLFAEQIYGKGWSSSLRALLWFAVGYAAFATVLELVRQKPDAALDAGSVVLTPLFVLLLVGFLRGYRPPPFASPRALLAGLTIFTLTVINEHLVANRLLPWRAQFETLGFFALLCCMGYVTIRQVLDNERHLVELRDEMRAATLIQNSILPRSVPRLEGAGISVRYLPMTAVAGDFYEFIQLDSKRAGIALADVAGHGVPAALVASMIKVAIGSHAALAADPAALMAALNNTMCEQARGRLITAGYLFLDLEQRRATYAAAAHPPVLVRRRGTQSLVELQKTGLILGVRPGETYPLMSLDLQPGDRILLYTDGIAEASNAQDQMFSEQRMKQALAAHDPDDHAIFTDRFLDEVRRWSRANNENGQADDMTLVVVDVD